MLLLSYRLHSGNSRVTCSLYNAVIWMFSIILALASDRVPIPPAPHSIYPSSPLLWKDLPTPPPISPPSRMFVSSCPSNLTPAIPSALSVAYQDPFVLGHRSQLVGIAQRPCPAAARRVLPGHLLRRARVLSSVQLGAVCLMRVALTGVVVRRKGLGVREG